MLGPSFPNNRSNNDHKELFLKIQLGEASPEEQARYAQMKAANSVVGQELELMENCWQQLFEYPVELNPAYDLPPVGRRHTSPRGWQLLAVAATLTFVALALLFSKQTTQPVSYQTAYNQYTSQELADESRVHLNASTRIAVNFDDRERRVQLKQGEALFEVAKDGSRRFIVETPLGEIQAIGTMFNVNLLSERLVVTIVEGTVMVSTPEQADGGPIGAEVASLNQRVVVNRQLEIKVANLEDTTPSVAWRSGKLVFSGQPLHEVLEIAGRHSQHKITILDSRLRELPVYGVFNRGDIVSLLAALESSHPLAAVSEGSNAFYLAYRSPAVKQ